jgi:hypothetical protein
MNRRTFLRRTAGSAAGLVILGNSSSVWSAQANQKLNVALVGVGGRGTWFVDTMPKMETVNNAEADALLRPEYRKGWSL